MTIAGFVHYILYFIRQKQPKTTMKWAVLAVLETLQKSNKVIFG